MSATLNRTEAPTQPLVVPMAKKAKSDAPQSVPTSPVRLHEDVAQLAAILAPIFEESVPSFLSNLLRPILEEKRREAGDRLKKWSPHKDVG